MTSVIAANLADVLERIRKAEKQAGRTPGGVTLCVVSKTVSVVAIREAICAGARDFGENYVQEALGKIAEISTAVRWHYIGGLQTNKVRSIVGKFDLIHSVDRESLAIELSRRTVALGGVQEVLIQVRLDPDVNRSGISPDSLPALVERVQSLPGLRLQGLMGLPPEEARADAAEPYFNHLKSLYDGLPSDNRRVLSMGMSGDLEAAVRCGSTMVRVGTAIFGARSLRREQ